ncbi:YiiX/YebB-like N1pC/P60 family cysteine hydrolase [Sediminimonas sp.]|uniref:YiiX/YebB-like N1pC/P60 family cysteine hydrolase n=1 Tax=Sediminimonas sp. TaxID=2823379 RepID=UPI0025EA7AFE|nr:YiiX/YebB-like N1pC/P60 family cysteine hydrolase [Sediminimonas sp.]
MANNLISRGSRTLAGPVLRMLAWLVLGAALVACTPPDPGVSKRELMNTPLEGCCANAESYPPPLVHLANPLAPVIGRIVGGVVMRKGYLAQPAAYAAAEDGLRPLDVLFVSSNGRLSGTMLPGLFSHAVIYLGSEAELKALGIWDDPALKPHHAAIRAGKTYIESSSPGVHLSDVEYVLATDAVAILRPPIKTRARQREAVRDFARRIGSDFDFHFDNATDDKLYCAELAAKTMPEAEMPTRRLYGRQTIMPDDVVALAVTGRGKMDFVGYLRGTRTGWHRYDRETLIADMNMHWRTTRRDPDRLRPLPPN